MKNKLLGLVIVALFTLNSFAASRLTTWSAGQILTAANLNAEIDNITVSGTVLRTGGSWNSADDVPVGFGAADPDARIEWATTQTVDSLVIGSRRGRPSYPHTHTTFEGLPYPMNIGEPRSIEIGECLGKQGEGDVHCAHPTIKTKVATW